ncbi:hypothetical protein BDZ94DRAFT_1264427, partial [Collybia nuda]
TFTPWESGDCAYMQPARLACRVIYTAELWSLVINEMFYVLIILVESRRAQTSTH